jgi:hypothetical protein
MIGLSYKTSESKAQNKSYNLIDYAWYFRFTDGLAYVRVNNINNSSYTALAVDNNKVYSIKKIGTKVQWLIDNVVVHAEILPLFTIGVLSQTPELPQLPTSQVTVVAPLVSIVTPPL